MTLARIEARFKNLAETQRTALVGFLTTGDPSVEDSYQCAKALLEAGVDVLELGVPFSDPTADGPVIAAASYRAIQNGGSLKAALDVARRLRADFDAPIVLFTYYNPIVAFGEQALPGALVDAGVDAVLVVDLPPEEAPLLRQGLRERDLGVVPLLTPTSGSVREQAVLADARGFIYYVSVTGVTGAVDAKAQVASENPLRAAGQAANALSARAGMPVVVGFGIDSPAKAREVAEQGVAGVVVGTAIVKLIAEPGSSEERRKRVFDFASQLRQAIDA
ncbi:MAG: tryptophan synthase subunit alpha [Polyangiaceae bacterium]|nr:tryptophan synthase subunit alpha [Polyangiaceae bacterium]MCB9605400.1 tryptophan synthase subunit alpha [Polyangiaceae bacterium]